MSIRNQTGSRNRGQRRQHSILEVRNFICAHIKRNDPASRRLVQYISMQSCQMVLLVRDAKTGKIVVQPPEKELWLLREKSGMGRAAKNEWNVIRSVGPDFFQEMDDYRQWHFGFKDVRILFQCSANVLAHSSSTMISLYGIWNLVSILRHCTITSKR